MSEGEKTMDNRRAANLRQLSASSPRDVAAAPSCKYVRQYAGPRKEFTTGRPFTDAASGRKPIQVKGRFSERRPPRFRGPIGHDTKEEVTKIEAPVPEYGSAQVWGPKKSNLNHLLNFHFESRDVHYGRSGHRPGYGGYGPGRYSDSRWSGRRGGSGWSSYSTFNKERFLQANCQFVVREGGDYTVHAVDPDVLVDWELIEQVRIFGHQVPSCPICLYPPKAAKITRCGHIYCWSCILHYLSLDDKTWRKCPICYEAVHEKDLKSVSALETHHYGVGEQITMKLMKKPRGTLRVMPAAAAESLTAAGSFPSDVNDATLACYSKLLSASISHIQSITDVERAELQQQLCDEEEGSLEGSFISAALTTLTEREMRLQSPVNKSSVVEAALSLSPENESVVVAASGFEQLSSVSHGHRYVSAFDDEIEDCGGSEILSSVDDCTSDAAAVTAVPMPGISVASDGGISGRMLEVSSSPAILMLSADSAGSYGDGDDEADDDVDILMSDLNLSKDDVDNCTMMSAGGGGGGCEPVDNAFYFYQAVDGQHIYMHAVNIHCMVKQYGSLNQCPPIVTATIVEMESVSMDEELRRRLRYLNHLPLTCEFVMAELDLQPPLLSPQVLALFKDELEKRKLNRQRRARNEKKHASRIQREENRSLGIDPTMRIVRSEFACPRSVQSSVVQSTAVDGDLAVVPVQGFSEPTDSCVMSIDVTSSSQDSSSVSPTTLSFAQMLKGGKSRLVSESWPKAGASGSGRGPGTVADVKSVGRRSSGSVGDSDGDDYQPVRRSENSLCDAIQAALDSYQCHREPGISADGTESSMATGGGTSTMTGKKKNKKLLLFSTSLPRTK